MNFNELNLGKPIQRAIAEFGYTTPSPIQQKAIPPVLEGHDLIGCAQTGTGKTAAFALPMLERLSQGKRAKAGEIRALILTPTRELALQIGQNFTDYGKYTGLRHTVIFGGVGQQPQIVALKKGLDVLIACPGRLNDLSNQGFVNLKNLEIFVLDEADRMLDMGFVHDVKRVVAKLPPKRQNLMFSATMPKEIEALANTFLTKPVMVKVNPVSSTVDKIEQSLYFVEKGNKLALLIHLVKHLEVANALVFSRTKHGADKIVKQLEKAGITAAAIHGNKGQTARVTALENFKAGKTQILVATDIAARGIDINELSHVFNFDLPEVPETYVHRIGRTARAGADGVAISFCASEEKEYLRGIEKLNRKQIPVVSEHPWAGKPSPIKAVIAPLRGKKPVAESQQNPKQDRAGAKPSRAIEKAAGAAPSPRQNEEKQMNDTENRGRTRGQNGRDGQNNRQGQGAGANQRDGRNQGRQNGGRNQGRNPGQNPAQQGRTRSAAPAQPKFDPRFLSPQAAEQVPHTAPVARTETPEMLDVRRMNQSRDNRDNRNMRDNRNASPNGRNPRNQNNRDGRNGGQNNRQNPRDTRNDRNDRDARSQGNAPRANGNGAANGANQARSAQNRPAQGGQAPRFQGGEARNTRNDRSDRNARDTRNDNATRGGRNQRNERNDYSSAPRGGQSANRGNKPAQAGLKTVRSNRPAPTNDKDPGLVLITKKPPQQKFTTFDDYMSAHGGATAPVENYGDK